MSDLLGFVSIALLFLFTMCLALRWSDIKNILFVALIIRIIILLFGHYFVTLPDSTADAETFERIAWEMGQEGFSHVLSQYNGFTPRFISWLIAIPYSVFGRSVLMAQSISIFFGISSILLGYKIAHILWNKNVANKAGWTLALFPSLALYSVLVMREVYVFFFITLAVYGIVTWVKTDKTKSFIIAIIGFIGAMCFHGAMFLGLLIFIAIVIALKIKIFFKMLMKLKISFKNLILISLIALSFTYYVSNNIHVSYLGSFEKLTNIDKLMRKTNVSTRGNASWPKFTVINSPSEFLYKGPLRSLYVIFSPFPWDIKQKRHLIGLLDSTIYLYLSFLILRNIKMIWTDPALRIILILLLSYIYIFGIGVGNFGTGIRHRSKFVIMFIILAAPFLPKFIFSKKEKID